MAASASSSSVDPYFTDAYRELKALARSRLHASGRAVQLDTTALVHETYLKLARMRQIEFADELRFLGYAGRAMRSIIVDLIRERQSERHGGGAVHITLTGDAVDEVPAQESHVLRVHEALQELEAQDERMARVVEMRYFAGLSELEIARALGVTDRTVRRDWEHARLFLAAALR